MSMQWYRARRAEKSIGGFGWRGWLGMGVLFAILIPHLFGFSWQHFVLETIWRIWDWPVLYWYVPRLLPIVTSLFAPEFSPVTVLSVLIAMQIMPVRLGRSRYVGLFIASFAVPYVYYLGYVYGWPMYDGGPEWFPSVVSLALGAACVWWATQSRFLGLVWLSMIPIAMLWGPYERSALSSWVTIPVHRVVGGNSDWPLPGYAVFLLTGTAAIWWAVRLRRLLDEPGLCRACGYSVEGITTELCPECGEAIKEDVTEVAEVSQAP